MQKALVVLGTLMLATGTAFAQAAKTATPPDITGVYKPISSKTVLPGGLKNAGTLADLPLTPAAAQKMKTVDLKEDPAKLCQPLGPFRMMARETTKIQILPVPGMVAILFENLSHGLIRTVFTERGHPAKQNPLWMGDSVGRWEGDTFVVDTIGFNDKTWIGGGGSIHSENMHVVERFTLNDDDSMTYQVMVEDPDALTKPYYTGSIYRRPIDVRVEEYECIENNPDPGHMNKAAGRTK